MDTIIVINSGNSREANVAIKKLTETLNFDNGEFSLIEKEDPLSYHAIGKYKDKKILFHSWIGSKVKIHESLIIGLTQECEIIILPISNQKSMNSIITEFAINNGYKVVNTTPLCGTNWWDVEKPNTEQLNIIFANYIKNLIDTLI